MDEVNVVEVRNFNHFNGGLIRLKDFPLITENFYEFVRDFVTLIFILFTNGWTNYNAFQ